MKLWNRKIEKENGDKTKKMNENVSLMTMILLKTSKLRLAKLMKLQEQAD